MAELFRLSADQTLLGHDGAIVPNGLVHFSDKSTGHYAQVFGDSGMLVALRQPVQADSHGVLPLVYLDDAIGYRAVIADAQNSLLREVADARRDREGIKVLNSLVALKAYGGDNPFALVAPDGVCPTCYRQLKGCTDLPKEHLPEVVHGARCSVWQVCRNEPNICATETAELNCDFQVLVQDCSPACTKGSKDCSCGDTPAGSGGSTIKKASIGALINAATKWLNHVCIPHDAPELALVGTTMVYGDREPVPTQWRERSGSWSGCIQVTLDASRHVRLDTLEDVKGRKVFFPTIALANSGSCKKRFELRAINRLNRAKELPGSEHGFDGVPLVDANFQTRLGELGDPLLDDVLGVADFSLTPPWLTNLSIADSTMGPFRSGVLWATGQDNTAGINVHPGTNGYSENSLVIDLNPGQTVQFALKYHIYWDMNASTEDLRIPERVHFGTTIMSRQVH